jgi:hypothetical protein
VQVGGGPVPGDAEQQVRQGGHGRAGPGLLDRPVHQGAPVARLARPQHRLHQPERPHEVRVVIGELLQQVDGALDLVGAGHASRDRHATDI